MTDLEFSDDLIWGVQNIAQVHCENQTADALAFVHWAASGQKGRSSMGRVTRRTATRAERITQDPSQRRLTKTPRAGRSRGGAIG